MLKKLFIPALIICIICFIVWLVLKSNDIFPWVSLIPVAGIPINLVIQKLKLPKIMGWATVLSGVATAAGFFWPSS